MRKEFSAVVMKGKIAYVALCPELGVASQDKIPASTVSNLKEAVELYLEDEDVRETPKQCEIDREELGEL